MPLSYLPSIRKSRARTEMDGPRKAVFFTRLNQELARSSSLLFNGTVDETSTWKILLLHTLLVFHFDVLLRIEITRVWQHLLGVPFKNWIKKKICRVRGEENNVTSAFDFYVEFVLFLYSNLKTVRLRRDLIIMENVVMLWN